ncbi:TniQ family protein [Lentilitoribacter sp. EG35]|uniref:TniQ family protein n=1 Tax=Lentilitoribacter sp. EG35 TaxID=3234192 RepID=UPI00346095C5
MNDCLPVTLPPLPGEVLSSWISRHADYYGVTPLNMLRHCLPEITTLRALDLTLSNDSTSRIAEMFSISSKAVRDMSFAMSPKVAHRFIAKQPVHYCLNCHSKVTESAFLRSELQGWRITCPICGRFYPEQLPNDYSSTFAPYHDAALRGEKLLNDHAEHGLETWLPPLEIARLMLMRRIPKPFPSGGDLWQYRLLGAIIPNLDIFITKQKSFPYSPKNPILPLQVRPALLAGIAIVEQSGPAMLKMLQGHMLEENRNRFVMATDHLIAPIFDWGQPQQLQLI